MYQASAITNIQDLQVWFEGLDRHGYWTIYRGNEKKPSERASSGVYESIESGWLALSQSLTIQTQGGGLFTVYVSRNEKDTSGFTTRFASSINIGLPYMQQQGIHATASIGALVQAQVSEQMEAFKKDQEIESLHQTIEDLKKGKGRKKGISGILSDFGELLEENQNLANIVTPIIHGIAARFLGNMDGKMPAIAGISHTAGDDPEKDKTANENEYTEDEINQLVDCINRLSIHFDNPIELLQNFTEFVEKDPVKAKMMISAIIKV